MVKIMKIILTPLLAYILVLKYQKGDEAANYRKYKYLLSKLTFVLNPSPVLNSQK